MSIEERDSTPLEPAAADLADLRNAIGNAFDEAEEPLKEAPEAEPEEEEEIEASDDDGEDLEEDDEPEDDDVDVPQNYSQKVRDWISTLDKEGQRIAVDRLKELDRGFQKKTEKLASMEKRVRSIDDALEGYREQFAREGVDEGALIKQLLAANNFLATQPEKALKWLADSVGVDLAQVAAPQQQEYVDPQIATLQAEIQQLRGFIQQQQQGQQQAHQAGIRSQIDAFAAEKDEGGNALRPHFEAVKPTMARMLQTGEANTLQEAYDKAIWATPKIRQELLKQQTQSVEQARKARLAKKVREPSSTTAVTERAAVKSLRDEIAEVMDSL